MGVPGRRGRDGGVDRVSREGGPSESADAVAAFILRLERPDHPPVRGTVAPVGDEGAALHFDGWVELMSAVETLRARETSSPPS